MINRIKITLYFILICSCFSDNALAQKVRLGDTSGQTKPIRLGLGNNPLRLGVIERNQRLGIQQVGEVQPLLQSFSRKGMIGRAQTKINRADRLATQGKLESAAKLYRQVIDTNPKLTEAYLGLSDTLVKMGDFTTAIEKYRQAISQSPNNLEARLNLGVALYLNGEVEQAIEQYKQVITVTESASAHFNLGIALAHRGDFNLALKHYQKAITQNGKIYPEAHNNLGLVYEALGEHEAAIKQFEIAIEQQRGNYPLAYYNLARFYSFQGKYPEAIGTFQLAIKQQSQFPEAYLELGNVYLLRSIVHHTNELKQSLAAYEKAIALRNDIYPLAHENRAIALTKKGDIKQALISYRTAFEQYEGRSPETLQNLIATISQADFFIVGNELSRTDNAGNLTYKKEPDQIVKRMLAVLEQYEELDEETKAVADVRYCVGQALVAVGHWPEAINEFAAAVKLSNNKDIAAKNRLASLLRMVCYL